MTPQDTPPASSDRRPAPVAPPLSCPEPDPPGAPLAVEVDVERKLYRGALLGLAGLWTCRHLFVALLARDVRVRYRHTWLGLGWAVLQPTLMMVIFTLFLGPSVADPDVPYPVFVYSGFVPWTFFSAALLAASQSVVTSEQLVTKVYFPRLLLPWASAGAVLIDLLGAGVGLAALMGWFGMLPSGRVVLAALALAFVALTAGGVGTLFAALNVRYRDFRYLVPFLVQLWLFSTPLLFVQGLAQPSPSSILAGPLSARLRAGLAALNPLNGLIGFFRAAVLGGPLPWGAAGSAALVAVALAVLGCWYYRRVEHRFADLL
jgi:lipopolysaccharide transport system permease protein